MNLYKMNTSMILKIRIILVARALPSPVFIITLSTFTTTCIHKHPGYHFADFEDQINFACFQLSYNRIK